MPPKFFLSERNRINFFPGSGVGVQFSVTEGDRWLRGVNEMDVYVDWVALELQI